jgi:hypothetical protein
VELSQFVARLQRELLAVAEVGGPAAREQAERLVAPLDSAVRLMVIELLAEAFDTITREISPGSVHLRLRGREPDIVVTPPPRGSLPSAEPPDARPPSGAADSDELTDGPMSRINFRPPEVLKGRIEEAAARERLSVNAWLVRVCSAAVEARPTPSPTARNHVTGWVG